MELTFTLRKDKIDKKGLAPIRMLITVDGERIRKVVKGIKTKPKYWKKERVKPNLKNEEYNFHIEFNKTLEELENKVTSVFRYIRLNNIKPTKEIILEKLENQNFGENKLVISFFEAYDEYITSNKNTRTPGTIRRYKTNKKFFFDFQEFTNYDIRFDTINLNFYQKLTDYAFEERNTLNNYFGKIIDGLKTFMKWSYERNYHDNLEFKKFKSIKNNIEVIYLTIEELKLLYEYQFESSKLEHVKDFYCFGCFTGMRFSDIKQLKPSNIYDDEIKFNVQKTKSIDHTVPLNVFAKQILEKYKETIYSPLPNISSQKFNQYIKEACKMAGIDHPINITRYIGQKRVDKVVPKYELITSHTAKKTFVTNSLILGMKESVIQQITGNLDHRTFKAYVNIANSLKKKEMNDTWNSL